MRRILVGTTFLAESLLLANDGESVDMSDIGAGGIWVSRIRSHHAYSRYRLSINTLAGKHYDVQVVIREDLDEEQVLSTIFWFIAVRGYPHGSPVLPGVRLLPARARRHLAGLRERPDGVGEDPRVQQRARSGHRACPPARSLAPVAGHGHGHGPARLGRERPPHGARPGRAPPTWSCPSRTSARTRCCRAWWACRPYTGPISLVRPLVKNFFLQTISHYPWVQEHLRLSWIFDAVREALHPAEARAFLRDAARGAGRRPAAGGRTADSWPCWRRTSSCSTAATCRRCRWRARWSGSPSGSV